ncbi:ABC transporter substrate-binding protein [Paenibacillus abyssi]|uniref:Sugar ABC transporter substrate-binding protein n=1 Tax=Paenibacillus abyssi TaxID=1340531 RepID=A0A917FPL8_9BACL|nr:extracellular solute-binding protein [Paenibacillus abyssi]GGF93561.1 sugar ABC transporter substrate-binding protein [Paenibacillus abyssi]
MAKKFFLSVLMVVMASVLILSGCSNGNNSAGGGSKVVNVAVGSFATSSLTMIKDEWEARTGATMNIIEIPFGSLYEKLVTSFATGTNSYDVVVYPSNWLSDFVEGNYIQDLEPFMAEKNNWDDIIPAFANMQKFDGKRYAVPIDGDSIIMYYRKDALENEEYKKQFEDKYGYPLAPPTTWAEYRDVAEFFNGWDWDNDGQMNYGALEALAPKNVDGYIYITRAASYAAHPDAKGYLFFDPETMEPQVNNPAFVKALEEWVEIKKFGPPNMVNYGGGEVRGNYVAGQSALAIDWADIGIMAQDPDKSKIKDKIGFALAPGSKEIYNAKTKAWDQQDQVSYAPYLAFSGFTTSITTSASNPELAFDLINSLDTDENALAGVTTPGTARNPYRGKHLEDPAAWENSPTNFFEPKGYLDTIKESYTHPNVQIDLRVLKAGSYLDALGVGIQQALAGEKSSQDALDAVAKEWNRLNEEIGVDNQKKFYLNGYNQ